MRGRWVALVVVVALLAPTPAAARWKPGIDAAIGYAGGRQGNVAFAVKAPDGKLFSYRGRTRVQAASVLKVMFMTEYLRSGDVRNRKLRKGDRKLLGPMIRWSDNTTASRINARFGAGPMYELAGDAGMKDFSYVSSPWGASLTSAIDQVRFMFHLERYIPNRHETYARRLLRNIVEEQRWGIGQVSKPRWTFFFKGGWGSGTGAVSHQVAFIERGDKRIALAVTTTGSPSHAYSTRTLEGVFRRLMKNLPDPG